MSPTPSYPSRNSTALHAAVITEVGRSNEKRKCKSEQNDVVGSWTSIGFSGVLCFLEHLVAGSQAQMSYE